MSCEYGAPKLKPGEDRRCLTVLIPTQIPIIRTSGIPSPSPVPKPTLKAVSLVLCFGFVDGFGELPAVFAAFAEAVVFVLLEVAAVVCDVVEVDEVDEADELDSEFVVMLK